MTAPNSPTSLTIRSPRAISVRSSALAFDEEDKPGLYLTATSVFGLQIVGADQNGDLREDRLRNGKPDAEWMNGQWGGIEGAGPGSIYKLDGEDGADQLVCQCPLERAG